MRRWRHWSRGWTQRWTQSCQTSKWSTQGSARRGCRRIQGRWYMRQGRRLLCHKLCPYEGVGAIGPRCTGCEALVHGDAQKNPCLLGKPESAMPRDSNPAPITIEYLDQTAACAWVRRHHTRYLEHVAQCSHNRKHRTFADAPTFCAHLLDWAPEERRELSKKLRALVAACWSWRAFLVRGPAWRFILANDDLEGGMPHTIHTAIVLPRWLVRTLLFETSDPTAKRTAYETVLHERIHVMQKASPEMFRRLYAAWGWKPVAQGGLVDRALDTLERSRPHPPQRPPQRWGAVRVAPTARRRLGAVCSTGSRRDARHGTTL